MRRVGVGRRLGLLGVVVAVAVGLGVDAAAVGAFSARGGGMNVRFDLTESSAIATSKDDCKDMMGTTFFGADNAIRSALRGACTDLWEFILFTVNDNGKCLRVKVRRGRTSVVSLRGYANKLCV